jgi:putative restriction endonuclease
MWIPPPDDWRRNIVRGKTYSTGTEIGRRLYDQVLDTLQLPSEVPMQIEEPRYGKPALIQPRLGQGGFRYAVTERYELRCAMTDERSLPALEAAHIKPYGEKGPHRVSNGLLLRADLHRLFDAGYITVTPNLRVEVSRHLRDDFSNGREYYAMHGRDLIVLPKHVQDKPEREFVEWHNENIFRV